MHSRILSPLTTVTSELTQPLGLLTGVICPWCVISSNLVLILVSSAFAAFLDHGWLPGLLGQFDWVRSWQELCCLHQFGKLMQLFDASDAIDSVNQT